MVIKTELKTTRKITIDTDEKEVYFIRTSGEYDCDYEDSIEFYSHEVTFCKYHKFPKVTTLELTIYDNNEDVELMYVIGGKHKPLESLAGSLNELADEENWNE